MIDGDAIFYWQAIASNWFGIASMAWICYLMRPKSLWTPLTATAPGASDLYCLIVAQSLLFVVAVNGLLVAFPSVSTGIGLVIAQILLLWMVIAQLILLWRSGSKKVLPMLLGSLLLLAGLALEFSVNQPHFWYPHEQASAEVERKNLELTQELMEAQPALLAARLSELKSQRHGVIDLYTITFAPYGTEDVFHNETAMVSKVMASRFDAAGRGVQLVNHPDTVDTLAWATPLNLRRSIQKMAKVMDLKEDILFLHLTSHGASDGELAAEFEPMSVQTLKPADLRGWLDEAGIRYSVISVSACFAGNWVAPLSSESTLVMTASDADHTSYGCGRKSDLTFFGRALYDEQLRNNTLSFEAAHAAARPIIQQREEVAGKDDGFSNPQIKVGAVIRERLALLQARLQTPSGTAQKNGLPSTLLKAAPSN